MNDGVDGAGFDRVIARGFEAMLALQRLTDLFDILQKCRHLARLDGVGARVDDHGAVSRFSCFLEPCDLAARLCGCIVTRLEVMGKTGGGHIWKTQRFCR